MDEGLLGTPRRRHVQGQGVQEGGEDKNDGTQDEHPDGREEHVLIPHHLRGDTVAYHLRVLEVYGAHQEDQSPREVQAPLCTGTCNDRNSFVCVTPESLAVASNHLIPVGGK